MWCMTKLQVPRRQTQLANRSFFSYGRAATLINPTELFMLNFAKILANLEAKLLRQQAAVAETQEHIELVKAQIVRENASQPAPVAPRERGK